MRRIRTKEKENRDRTIARNLHKATDRTHYTQLEALTLGVKIELKGFHTHKRHRNRISNSHVPEAIDTRIKTRHNHRLTQVSQPKIGLNAGLT